MVGGLRVEISANASGSKLRKAAIFDPRLLSMQMVTSFFLFRQAFLTVPPGAPPNRSIDQFSVRCAVVGTWIRTFMHNHTLHGGQTGANLLTLGVQRFLASNPQNS